MFTVVETALFSKFWSAYWSEEERGAFAAYIAEHSTAGDVRAPLKMQSSPKCKARKKFRSAAYD